MENATRIHIALRFPSAPRDLEIIQINSSTVKISWEKPFEENGEIIGYYIYKDKLYNGEPVNNKLQRAIIYDKQKTHTIISDLEPNTEYSFRVNAFNRFGDGEFSSTKKILTSGLPPSEPITQSVTLTREEPPLSARLDWKPPKITYNLPINRYIIWYKPSEIQEYKRLEVPSTQNYVELHNLMMGKLYEINVAAENDDGLSINATEFLTTPIGIPESEPTNIRYEINGEQMTISWDAPNIAQQNGNITYYRAILTPVDSINQNFEKNVTSGRSVTYDINSRKAYIFKVAAATIKGQGPFSARLRIDSNPNGSFSFLSLNSSVKAKLKYPVF
ncbi:unnamed protein product [Dracunculus medinensis]|uniref:Fibronectin type-III domain-containing protein n=1 Tax=Dracunculus medinensis TaxID=318479 RepID=A0A0N4UMP0_DRAME|nr:unnamed protein product [Dracunculus medinensis]